jgi:hypothetical protein
VVVWGEVGSAGGVAKYCGRLQDIYSYTRAKCQCRCVANVLLGSVLCLSEFVFVFVRTASLTAVQRRDTTGDRASRRVQSWGCAVCCTCVKSRGCAGAEVGGAAICTRFMLSTRPVS